MSTLNWSEWHALESKSITLPVPDSPGVYEVRTNIAFGRLKGYSAVVFIGSSVRSLKKRLLGQRIGNPERFLSGAEKYLRQAGHSLQFRYAETVDGLTARNLESQMLKDCDLEYWELPPGNAVLPRPKLGTAAAKTVGN